MTSTGLNILQRSFVSALRLLTRFSAGYDMQPIQEEMVRTLGVGGTMRMMKLGAQVTSTLSRAVGDYTAQTLIAIAAMWNGCRYCVIGHNYSANLYRFRDLRLLGPLDEDGLVELMSLTDDECHAALRQKFETSEPRTWHLIDRMFQLRFRDIEPVEPEDQLLKAFQEMCAEVRAVLGISSVGVALIDERDGLLVRRAHVGLPPEWIREAPSYSLSAMSPALERGEIMVIGRAEYERRAPDHPTTRFGLTGSVVAPMRHEGRLIGVLVGLQFGGDWPGRREDIAWLEAVAGLLVEVVVAGRTLEALRLSEQRYRRIVTTTQEGVWTVDAAQRTTFVNQRMADIVGYAPEELLGRALLEFIPPEETTLLAGKFAERRAGVHDRYEHHFIRKDGSRVAVQASTSPLLDEDGTFVGALAMVRDVTELRQLAARVLHGQKLESLSVLAGGVAHDFNNLLAVVLGNVGVARAELPAELPVQALLADAETAASRAAELTAQMLAYAGKGRFVVQRLNLNRMIGEQLQLMSAVISKKARLETELAEELPEIEGDVAQLRQVLMNLITNASDALGDGPGVITLQTSVIEADRALLVGAYLNDNLSPGRRVCLTVRDTGCGFEAAAQTRIFDPFFTTKFTGRGLGLAAVVGILRGHKGAVLVESTPGRGSCFRVLLPCASPLAAQTRSAERAPRRDGLVLVVDDEPGVRMAARRVLERGGLRVCVAVDGREAISAFAARQAEIDVVLLDMTMPHLRGDEVYRELRRIRGDVRVVLSSGFSDPALVADIGGEVGFLAKPWTPQQLLAAVDAALGQG